MTRERGRRREEERKQPNAKEGRKRKRASKERTHKRSNKCRHRNKGQPSVESNALMIYQGLVFPVFPYLFSSTRVASFVHGNGAQKTLFFFLF